MLFSILTLKFTTIRDKGKSLNKGINNSTVHHTYIWSAFVCSIACTNCLVRLSSLIESKLFASSATRGWNNNDLWSDVITNDSDIGSSLKTEKTKERNLL